MFVSRMFSQWHQTVWILWYSYVCIQDGLSLMSNCMNIVIFYVCIQHGLTVMSNFMNIVIFLCLYPAWSLSDIKLYEYCHILMFVSRMVWQWCLTVWILWYSYVCIQDGISVMSNCMNIVIFLCLCRGWSLCDVKLYEYCDILMFGPRMVSLWCQTVWILWYSYVCIQDGLPVMSNCMNIVIFLCLHPGWSLNDIKLYEYCDILMFVSRMVSQWCQNVWILWYSYVCVQDGLSVMSNCMNTVIFLCLCPGWPHCIVKLYEYCDILCLCVGWSQLCQTVWILWYSYVCVQDGLSVMSNWMNIVIFLCLCVGWSQLCQTVWILWYSCVCVHDGLSVMSNCMNIVIFLCLCPGWSLSDVKLYEFCDILMFVSRMVSLWCQTVWLLWYSYVSVQDDLPVMSNCMNIVIYLCMYPGWSLCDVKLYEYCDILMFVSTMVSLWCQTVWILWYSYVCVQDGLIVISNCMNIVIFLCLCPGGLSVMSNCMNIVIFLCLCPGWSLSDVKLYEFCDILMFVSRMVSQWCQIVWILWYSYVCVQDGLSVMSNCMNIVIFLCLCPGWSNSDVKLYEYCDILMYVSRMVSLWCQTVWILWYFYVCIQDGLPVMSNFMNIVIFLCLCSGWSPSDVKLYEYCDILMFVPTMVSQWCQIVWILWYSYVCVQDGFSVMSNCMNIVIFLCLCPGWSQWCQTVWILWYSYVCVQDGLSVMSNSMNIVIFLFVPRWSLSDVKLYEYCDILMFVSTMVSLWCQTVWILWYSYVCVQLGLSVMSNCMNIVIFLCLCQGWSHWCQTVWILWYSYVCVQDGLSGVKLYEYCDILMFVSRMVSQWWWTVWILWYSYVCIQDGLSVMCCGSTSFKRRWPI